MSEKIIRTSLFALAILSASVFAVSTSMDHAATPAKWCRAGSVEALFTPCTRDFR